MTTWLSSWRRLLSTIAVCFALFFALLAWRVSSGADPVLASAAAGVVATPTATSTATEDSTTTEDSMSSDDSAATTQSTTPSTQAS